MLGTSFETVRVLKKWPGSDMADHLSFSTTEADTNFTKGEAFILFRPAIVGTSYIVHQRYEGWYSNPFLIYVLAIYPVVKNALVSNLSSS